VIFEQQIYNKDTKNSFKQQNFVAPQNKTAKALPKPVINPYRVNAS
jgi:hypothetical protein